jgi:hypothetical protein
VKMQINVIPGPVPARSSIAGMRAPRRNRRPVEDPIELRNRRETGSIEENPPERLGRGQKWHLDDVSLGALLKALAPDVEQAARKYANLRERLTRFFAWNRTDNADELADETLDRLARRLGRTEAADSGRNRDSAGSARKETIERPEEFAAGIARLVLHEQRRRKFRAEQAFDKIQREAETDRVAWRTEELRRAEERSAVLEKCMAELSEEQRELIRRYYSVEGRTMIDARKRLAEEMCISVNALRNRALRIRAELEGQVRSRLAHRS